MMSNWRTIVAALLIAVFIPTAGALAQEQQSERAVYVCPPCPVDCHDTTYEEPGTCTVCGMTLVKKTSQRPTRSGPRNVAIVVHDGVELLDFAGPTEVFQAAGSRNRINGEPAFRVYTVAPAEGDIVSQGMLTIRPEFTIDNCPPPDILVVPGGATSNLRNNEAFMTWAKQAAYEAEIAFSVCTGAFVYADIGLLDGLQATTHWSSIDRLRGAVPSATVLENIRYVDNGAVITTAGISAGMDGALHVVARLLGRAAAEQTARYMEYDWRVNPEYAQSYSEYAATISEEDRLRQQANTYRTNQNWKEAITAYRAVVELDPEDGLSWYHLGYSLHITGQLQEAIDAHKKAATFDQYRSVGLFNLACAYALLGGTDESLDALANCIEAGWTDRAFIEQDTDLQSIRSDPRYREIIDAIPPS